MREVEEEKVQDKTLKNKNDRHASCHFCLFYNIFTVLHDQSVSLLELLFKPLEVDLNHSPLIYLT